MMEFSKTTFHCSNTTFQNKSEKN